MARYKPKSTFYYSHQLVRQKDGTKLRTGRRKRKRKWLVTSPSQHSTTATTWSGNKIEPNAELEEPAGSRISTLAAMPTASKIGKEQFIIFCFLF
jgi:hypothetical protein